MKRKKSFDSSRVFMCFFRILPPSYACVCVCVCIKALPSHSSLFLCPSYFTPSQPPPSLSLSPARQPPCHLPFFFSACQSALLPYLVLPLKVFRCITPPLASRNGKVTRLTRNTEPCAAPEPPNLFPYPRAPRLKNTQLGRADVNVLFCAAFITRQGIK